MPNPEKVGVRPRASGLKAEPGQSAHRLSPCLCWRRVLIPQPHQHQRCCWGVSHYHRICLPPSARQPKSAGRGQPLPCTETGTEEAQPPQATGGCGPRPLSESPVLRTAVSQCRSCCARDTKETIAGPAAAQQMALQDLQSACKGIFHISANCSRLRNCTSGSIIFRASFSANEI